MKLRYFLSILVGGMLFLFLSPKVDAAYLYLEPTSQTFSPGTEFDVALKINTEGAKPTTSDTLIEYDSNNLSLVDVIELEESEAFFPEFYDRVSGDTIYIGAYIRLGSQPVSGDGTIAILRFKGLNVAQTYVNFLCTDGDTTDSNISLKQNRKVTDVIDCANMENGTYVISDGGDVPTPTPRPTGTGGGPLTPVPTVAGATPTLQPTLAPTAEPTASPSATQIPTPSVLPETGFEFNTTRVIMMLGVILGVTSILIKVYVS